jgi:DNA-binding HxlR family transcriptional regulator
MSERGNLPVTANPSAGRGDLFAADCPTRILLDRVGGKWVAMVIKLLADKHPAERGFAELARQMPGVSHKMLSQTLKALVRDRLVERRVEDSVPPRVHYRLTELGSSLQVPLAALTDWAEEHVWQIDRESPESFPRGL